MRTQREKMWNSFHTLRVSNPFQKLWHDFLDLSHLEEHPLFYQNVTDRIFQDIITREFASTTSGDEPAVATITYEEENALRYVAGYVCRRVKENVEKLRHPFKEALLLCMMDLCDKDDETSSSADC